LQIQSNRKFNSTFPLPTVAMDDPHVPLPLPPHVSIPLAPTSRATNSTLIAAFQFCATFDADLMWRGPVWGFTNWLVTQAPHSFSAKILF
jgi:hypothetical protein